MTAKNLGEILLEQGIIDRETLDRALGLQSRRLGEILIQEQLVDPVAIAQALKAQAKARPGRRSTRLNVDIDTLDGLLNRIERLEDALTGRRPDQADSSGNNAQRPQDARHSSLSLAVEMLRGSVESLLLEPVESLFAKARWVAQQASAETGKQIELTCEGGGLVVDRSMVDELSDMLLHLVRNAVDHGIEPASVRASAGKPAHGAVRLGVSIQGARLHMSVSDDGGGIDEDAFYVRAVERKLFSKARESATSQELQRLLFTPGFSTATHATALSGRGVGLDVVEAAVIRLGGEVKVSSRRGEGTSFTVSVPLRLARLTVLPVRSGEEWVCVAATEIAQVEQVTDSTSLIPGAALFPEPSPQTPEAGNTARKSATMKLECSRGSRWAFDEVGAPEDALVREAAAGTDTMNGVIGGVRLKDGRDVLLVDLNALAQALPVAAPRT